jgi:hypothetical protein
MKQVVFDKTGGPNIDSLSNNERKMKAHNQKYNFFIPGLIGQPRNQMQWSMSDRKENSNACQSSKSKPISTNFTSVDE